MRYLASTFFSLVCLTTFAQTSTGSGPKFGPQWQALAGSWSGESSAGVGSGSCAFQFQFGGHILVRTNHAEVVAAGNRPGGIHDDLMVIYPGANENQAKAIYWDNEGHVIEYAATWAADGNTLSFLSKSGPGPQFRLTYKKVDADTFDVSFDMAAPGGAFKPYTSGRIRRQK
jgi:hypothetical protein